MRASNTLSSAWSVADYEFFILQDVVRFISNAASRKASAAAVIPRTTVQAGMVCDVSEDNHVYASLRGFIPLLALL